jgi:hypothetical protein
MVVPLGMEVRGKPGSRDWRSMNARTTLRVLRYAFWWGGGGNLNRVILQPQRFQIYCRLGRTNYKGNWSTGMFVHDD